MKALCRLPRLWALTLALSGGCQIDYPMSTDFPSESAQVEVDA